MKPKMSIRAQNERGFGFFSFFLSHGKKKKKKSSLNLLGGIIFSLIISPKQYFPWQQDDGTVYVNSVKTLEVEDLPQEGSEGKGAYLCCFCKS